MAQALTAGSEAAELMSARVADIERCLSALEVAFASGEGPLIDQQCQMLQRSLAESLAVFRQAEQAGIKPLRAEVLARLKLAQARVQAQQVAVHRAHASIDRTLSVLLPRQEQHATYGSLSHSPAAKALNAYR